MTLVARPTPPNVRPERAAPSAVVWSCACETEDPELVRMKALMAGGMSQHDASQEVWGAPPRPAAPVELPPAITPRTRRPNRHARLLNRWINKEVS